MFHGIVVVMALILMLIPVSEALSEGLPFRVKSRAAVLGDVDSGTILFSQEADVRVPPASLTKVMTLYLVYEALANGNLSLDQRLPVSEKAWRMGGSKTFVHVGDKVRVEDLIRGIAVQSGNDACMVVAEHIGGSEKGFADLMNQKAKDLGLHNSNFMNSSGMPTEGHFSTARDMFILASSIVRHFPQYAHYAKEKQYTFNGIRQYNRNRLLWRDPSITGLKTGHTRAAGYCLIATNENDGQRLAAVIMGADRIKTREEEALRLLRFGNRTYETVRLFEANSLVRRLRIWKGDNDHVEGVIRDPLLVTVPRKERDTLEVGLLYDDPILAPIHDGQKVGTLVVKLGKEELLSRPVVAGAEVAEGGFFRTLLDSVRLQLGW
ncbi:MAG: D-alanyl-D-alanine carboxypeptidase [Magnetococcales bacterium]|nr:D-alanyl-D-alanine carboxypeptidase [Magnetococcales bacterium]